MKVIILEDEAANLRLLKGTLERIDPTIEVVNTFGDIKNAVEWLKENPEAFELAFFDIRLSDGLSLQIFSQVEIKAPVIFVTAYDEYALEAFNTNGIAYLLKPIDEEQVQKALDKHKKLALPNSETIDEGAFDNLIKALTSKQSYRQSYLIHYKDKLVPVKTSSIAWINTEHEICKAKSFDGITYTMDGTLEKIMEELDPYKFYRANRQYIISRDAVEEVHFYFNGRLSLNITHAPKERILVSKAKAAEFKDWMNQ